MESKRCEEEVGIYCYKLFLKGMEGIVVIVSNWVNPDQFCRINVC